jgi:hypothetical protein
MAVFVLFAVIGIGVFYFKLHALPEHLAHGGHKVQFQIVSVLALLALFTHNHVFWIAGLLLALIPIPDLTTPLSSMAHSLDRMARSAEPAVPPPRPAQERALSDDTRAPSEAAAPPPAQEAPSPATGQPIAQRGA